MKRLISVFGMTTENCRTNIIKRLEKEESIEDVNVILQKGLVEVVFDNKVITLEQIKKLIHELGYDPM